MTYLSHHHVQVNHQETAEKPEERFVRLNKNLCNYPIARDPHVKLSWCRSKRTNAWIADLPATTACG